MAEPETKSIVYPGGVAQGMPARSAVRAAASIYHKSGVGLVRLCLSVYSAGVGVYDGPRGLDADVLRYTGACDGGGVFFLPSELCRVSGGCHIFAWPTISVRS